MKTGYFMKDLSRVITTIVEMLKQVPEKSPSQLRKA